MATYEKWRCAAWYLYSIWIISQLKQEFTNEAFFPSTVITYLKQANVKLVPFPQIFQLCFPSSWWNHSSWSLVQCDSLLPVSCMQKGCVIFGLGHLTVGVRPSEIFFHFAKRASNIPYCGCSFSWNKNNIESLEKSILIILHKQKINLCCFWSFWSYLLLQNNLPYSIW